MSQGWERNSVVIYQHTKRKKDLLINNEEKNRQKQSDKHTNRQIVEQQK